MNILFIFQQPHEDKSENQDKWHILPDNFLSSKINFTKSIVMVHYPEQVNGSNREYFLFFSTNPRKSSYLPRDSGDKNMLTEAEKQIRIDLNQFKFHLNIEHKIQLSLHFDTTSRKFYLAVIAFVLNEMKKNHSVKSIPLKTHHELLALLNETVGDYAGSSQKGKLIPRIYKKWKTVLPNLEDAHLFRVIGRKKEYGSGIDKVYVCSDVEKDSWANLFDYKGSGENARLRFSVDALGVQLDHSIITYKGKTDEEAWERFVAALKKDKDAKSTEEKIAKIPAKTVSQKKSPLTIWRRFAPVAIIVLIVAFVGLLSWNSYIGQTQRVEPASVDQMAYPLPDKPSIAVLPFKNMSGDSDQEYFSDGLTEEIITALSKIPQLFVIARNSTFTYKGKAVKIQQVSEELGVRYVLEGSVRKANDQIRITAQFIDAITGQHLWAERYDRKLKDIFAIQDEITIKIINELQLKLTESDAARGAIDKTKNLEAYLKVLQSNEHLILITPHDNIRSRQLAQEAINLDPNYTAAWAMVAYTHLLDVMQGTTQSTKMSIEKAIEIAQKIEKMGDKWHTPILWAFIYHLQRNHEKAISEMQKALVLNPNNDWYNRFLGDLLIYSGRPREAITRIQKAMRLNPFYPTLYLCKLGQAYQHSERYDEAIEAFKGVLKRGDRDFCGHLGLAAVYIHVGREEEAKTHAQELLKIVPQFSLSWFQNINYHWDQTALGRTVEALRKAGLN